nr:alpha/beta hydrolase [Sphingomonas caseinilyticus]
MHYVDEGSGPLVILLHGFPYLWYMWRLQIPALVAAGYRVLAPDLRGFGQTEKPEALEAYDMLQAVGDIVGLMKAQRETSAVLVGHDLGAWVAYMAAQLRPDLFSRLAILNTPVPPRGPSKPSVGWAKLAKQGVQIHHSYFQERDTPDRELAHDTRKSLRSIFYSVSGSPDDCWNPIVPMGTRLLDTMPEPDTFPDWLSDRALDHYVAEYERTGFTGALNYYRCRDRNWELTPFLDGSAVRQPSLFIGGAYDPLMLLAREGYETLETHMPGLRRKVLLEGIGHDAPEEAPEAVNAELLAFLAPGH